MSQPPFMVGPPIGWERQVPGAIPPKCKCGAWEQHWNASGDGRPAQDCAAYRAWIMRLYGGKKEAHNA